MQAVHTYEDEGDTSGRTNPIGIVIYAGRISRCLEGEYDGRPEERITGIQNSRRIFDRHKKEV